MFKRMEHCDQQRVEIVVNQQTISVPAGISVAAALLTQDYFCRMTAVGNVRRGPFCMMGVCFDCLVEIDGVANQQGCMRQVQQGMQIHYQQGAVRLDPDKAQ